MTSRDEIQPPAAVQPASRPRGPYRATAAKREQILEAAAAELADHDYEAASLRSIATRVGMSHNALLHHFPSKDDLLIALLEQREQEDRALVERYAGATDLGDIAESFSILFARYQDSPTLSRLWVRVNATSAGHPDHPAHAFVVRRYQRWTSELTEVLERAQAAGSVDAGLDARATAIGLVAMLQGLLAHSLADPALDTAQVLANALDRLRSPSSAHRPMVNGSEDEHS